MPSVFDRLNGITVGYLSLESHAHPINCIRVVCFASTKPRRAPALVYRRRDTSHVTCAAFPSANQPHISRYV